MPYRLFMVTIAPSSSVSTHETHGEVHFSVGGFWKLDEIQGFLEQLNTASMPIVQANAPIRVLGEMRDFVAQNRETADAIRDHLMMSQKYGLERVAIVAPPALVKIQYRRLSQGIDVEFFDNKTDALAWLRRPR